MVGFILIILGFIIICGVMTRGRGKGCLLLPLAALCGLFLMVRVTQPLPLERQLEKRDSGILGALVMGYVSDLEQKEDRWVCYLRNCQIEIQEKTYDSKGVLIYLSEPVNVKMGMKLKISGKLEAFPKPGNPGQFNQNFYYKTLNLEYRLSGNSSQILNYNYSHYKQFLYTIKERLKAQLSKIADPFDLPVFSAVLLGEKGQMDQQVKELYQKNGIAHLLAISGLHISFLGMGFYHILRKIGLSFVPSSILGAIVVISYGVMIGNPTSGSRAIIMILLMMLADCLGRTYDMITAISIAAILLLIQNPLVLMSGGFQLSFGAVLAIGVVAPILSKWLHVKTPMKKSIIVSLSVQMVTYPILLYHFFQYPIYGILLNLIVIPFMAYVLISIILGILISFLWLPLGILALGTGHYILFFYQWIAGVFSKLPAYNMIIGRPGFVSIFLYYVGLVLLFIWMWCSKTEFEEEGIQWRGFAYSQSFRLICLCVICLAAIGILRPWKPAVLEITFVDVGQGDGIFLQTQEGITFLIDGGSSDISRLGSQRLEPFLKSKGITQIDYVIVSHGDMDHISGIKYLLGAPENPAGFGQKEVQSLEVWMPRDIKIRNLVLPDIADGDPSYEELKKLAQFNKTAVLTLGEGDTISTDTLDLTCLHPNPEYHSLSRNGHSIVLHVSFKQFDILFTGDLEADGENQLLESALLDNMDVLKIAHHGSKYSSTPAFLDRVKPKWAVISCGKNNSYAHPHTELLDRLSERKIICYKTTEGGAVLLRTDGRKVQFSSFRK